MAYDFKRNYTSTFSNGVATVTVNSSLRTSTDSLGRSC